MPQFLVHLTMVEHRILSDYFNEMDAVGLDGSIIYDVISQLVSDAADYPLSAIAGGYYETKD